MSDRELVDLVLRFARELNALQRRYGPQMPQSRREGRMAALLDAYRGEVGELYRRRLTERKRSYYKPLPDPPTFSALERLALSTVARKGNLAVVEVLTSRGCLDFRFHLLRKDGVWRIDSYQQRYHSACRVDHWTYGIF